MKLFFGLGNPDSIYQHTRHNLGQMVIQKFIESHHLNLQSKSKLLAHLTEFDDHLFAISTEYMNVSGQSVQKISSYFKIHPENIYLIHDDLDLAVGEWKLQFDRGPAGHNGVISTIESLSTQAFWRIRIGISKPEKNIPVEDYVLKSFLPKEKVIITETIDKIVKDIDKIIHF
jgi:PTH1 family peptidyl-tRNA hydrolase